MSLNKKLLIGGFLIIFGLLGVVFAGFADTYNNITYQSIPSTYSIYQYVKPDFNSQYQNISVRITPHADISACSAKIMMDTFHRGDSTFGFGAFLSSGSFEGEHNITDSSIQVPPASTSASAFTEAVFSNGCQTLKTGFTYWLRFYINASQTANNAIYHDYGNVYTSSTSLAYAQYGSSNPVADSSYHAITTIPNFQLTDGGSGGETAIDTNALLFPPATASTSNPDFGIFGNYIRDVLIWLFKPSPASLAQFGTLKDGIASKPPFGYYTLIKDDFSGLATSSATVSFYDLSSISSILNPIKTGLAVLLWVLYAVFLIKRFTNFDFHL